MGSVTPYDTVDGKRYRVRYRKPDRSQTDKRGFRTKRDAELFLASVEVSKARGEYVDATAAKIPVGSLGVAWLEGRKATLKPSAYRPLEITWRLHVEPRWGTTDVGQVQHSDVQAWASELATRRSATVTLRAHGILAGVLDAAVADRRVPRNVARAISLPRKVGKRHVYLTHEQVEALAEECGDNKTLVLVLAYTGLRWGELVGLRVRNLDMLRRRIQVDENAVHVGGEIIVGTPKTHKRRSVPFSAFLAEPLAQQCEGKGRDDLVFGNGVAHKIRPDQRGGWFAYAKKRAKTPPELTIHDLRHTAASLAIAAGANVKAVQRMLGHASAAMTLDTYADLFDDDLDAVAEALDHARSVSNVGKVWAKPAR